LIIYKHYYRTHPLFTTQGSRRREKSEQGAANDERSLESKSIPEGWEASQAGPDSQKAWRPQTGQGNSVLYFC
jgi:hypothetical protein